MTVKGRRIMAIAVAAVLALIAGKSVRVHRAMRGIGSFETEKEDILQRRDWLLSKVLVEPSALIAEMPAAVGPQFQGEWALYSCSMLSAALVNIALLYPETREQALPAIDSLIKIVMSPELRQYDAVRWDEDPLESLSGMKSHISYLSHLSWMISGYKRIGGDRRYDAVNARVCEAMNRRILASAKLNLQTYPRERIYVPDMLVAIVALSNYARQNGGRYRSTAERWEKEMKANWTDRKTGILQSTLPDDEVWMGPGPVKGSYSALSCYYLTFVDKSFAKDQYELLKKVFFQKHCVAGIREYHDRRCLLGIDVDAGPIVMNLSPTGTAFAVGGATFFEDHEVRGKLMKTAELAGSSVSRKGKRHYKLADMALVGEAIMLAMRTAVAWY